MEHYPDDSPVEGWPAAHARRLNALENSLPLRMFAATLLGSSLPHYLPPELLAQARSLAQRYPEGAALVGLFLVLGWAKIPPPEHPALRAVWEFWARWAPSPWDRLGGLKMPGAIEPPAPAAGEQDANRRSPRDRGEP